MTTDFQEVYDAFFIKVPENFLYKQDQVFQYLKSAIAKSYKTIDTKLDYNQFLNNSVIVVNSTSQIDGIIELNINEINYKIDILKSNTLNDIANSIKNSIKRDWDVELDISNIYPILKITKSYVNNITTKFIDTNNTCIELVISKTYDGEFINKLGQDEIELLALFMQKEYLRQKLNVYSRLKTFLGTKDFNRLPEKSSDYKILSQSIKDLDDEIYKFRQEFYHYQG